MTDTMIEGVRLTPLKAKLFALIEGQPGMSNGEIAMAFYAAATKETMALVRQHVIQINKLMASVGVRIYGHPYVGYRVERAKNEISEGVDRQVG